MKPTPYSSSFFGSRILAGKLTGVLLCLLLAQAACAQLYVNSNSVSYSDPGTPAIPTIDATAFANQSVFSCSYGAFINNNVIYCEPWWGTLFYTNDGEMMVNASGGNSGFSTLTTGVGFKFDLQQANSNQTNSMAGTFFNPGIIHCNSFLDGNAGDTIGECIVSATNIIVPGNINVGVNGLLSLNGQHVDLSRSVLTMEQGSGGPNSANVGSISEGEGFDTNGDWNPGVDLTTNTASASFPDFLDLFESTPYYGVVSANSNLIYRCVFIQNESANVSYNVYVAPAAFNNEGALIQWAGTYIDPASGSTITNYLYLYHFYFSPSATNFGPIVEFGTPPTANDLLAYQFGSPNFYNFVWTQSSPLAGLGTNANTPNFPSVFADNPLTNIYEFFNSDLVATTVTPSSSGTNPDGALTNLPNQVTITGSQELNLALTQITGENYLSLVATNQFDGSAGAQINAPFYDINLGVTNGTMTVSNLVAKNIPSWGGTLDEWSTSWTNVDTSGGTNSAGTNDDIRVMLVNSDLTPTISPQVENMTLNVTNNLIISDVLNVLNSFYATPVSLTLTTNGIGVGANSPEGELNFGNGNSVTWSWGGSFPNLLWLTNDGAITIPNFATFVGNSNIVTVVSNTPAVAASDTLSELVPTNNVNSGSTVTIGITPYTFTATAISSVTPANTVEIGKTLDATMTNLIAAINFSAGAGKVYGTNGSPFANGFVSAAALINHAFTVAALDAGSTGDTIPVSTTATNLAWNGLDLSGGANAIPGSTNVTQTSVPYGAFISDGLFEDQGSTIWANYFLGSGVFSSGNGTFTLNATTAVLTNDVLSTGGAVSITANTLLTSNLVLLSGQSLTLAVTNWLSDGGVTNNNFWTLDDSTNAVGFNSLGLELPFLPANTAPNLNNLLATTISMQAPAPAKEVFSTWAGRNYGASTLGYQTNNVAIGRLILNAVGQNSSFFFSGTGTSNALYVDQLVLDGFAAYATNSGGNALSALNFNPNLVIYYADAISSGQDISSAINGFNNSHLVWVPAYTGFFTSTNGVNPSKTPPPAPGLGSLGLANGQYRLSISGSPAFPVVIQTSTNLVNWVGISTNVPPFNFTDAVSSPFPYRFYRATMQ